MEVDFEGLKNYLLNLTAEDIRNQVGLKECSCQNEIERQEKRCGKKYIYKENEIVIPHGGFHLVDILGNDLTVVKTARRKYKTPSGRIVHRKIIQTIIDDCQKVYGTCINGYWAIPKEFIKEE